MEKEIYRIKLPGNAKVGEGKPENQNHAIIFTRGQALQTIDMNQVFLLFLTLLELVKTVGCQNIMHLCRTIT